jgi:hypothetical protein
MADVEVSTADTEPLTLEQRAALLETRTELLRVLANIEARLQLVGDGGGFDRNP